MDVENHRKDSDKSLDTSSGSIEIEESKNLYIKFLARVDFCKLTFATYQIANLIQFIWGCELGLVSNYIRDFGLDSKVDPTLITVLTCLAYCATGLGSLVIGFVTDNFGRITLLKFSSLAYFLLILCCTFISNFYIFASLRIFANLFMGIFNILIMDILCEILPNKNRTFRLMFDIGFSNFGYFYIAVLQYCFWTDDFSLPNLKIINGATLLPALLSLILIYSYAKESPLLLLNLTRDQEAFNIMDFMAKSVNYNLTLEEKIEIRNDVRQSSNFQIQPGFRTLFSRKFIRLTFVYTIIYLITYFNSISLGYLDVRAIEKNKNNLYLSEKTQLLISAAVQLPVGIIGGLMADKRFLRKRNTLIFTSIFCGVFLFISYMTKSYVYILEGVIYFFNNIGLGICFISISVYYPSILRDYAQSLINFVVFLIGSWALLYVDFVDRNNTNNLYLHFGMFSIICGFTAFLMRRQTTEEDE